MSIVTCSAAATWDTIVGIATTCAQSGKENTDFFNVGVSWVSTTELTVDDELINAGAFQQSINSINYTSENNKLGLANLREQRDKLLKDSDWTQLADKGGLSDSKVTEWATYRQSLRDLPTASGWPHTHTLPTKPS